MNYPLEPREYEINEVFNKIYRLCEEFAFLEAITLGKSHLGRPLLGVKIGVKDDTVLHVGGFHGSERLTTLVNLMFIENFCISLRNNGNFALSSARNAIYNKSIIVVPCINPDGYEISRGGFESAGYSAQKIRDINGRNDIKFWNANAAGVDINHNFDAGYEQIKKIERAANIVAPAPRRYGGIRAHSEPETKALVELVHSHNINSVYAWHSQGEEIYWQYGEKTPKKSLKLANLLAACSGYTVAHPPPGASHAGFKDWFINTYERPGFTIEIGSGENPLNPKNLYDIYAKIEEMFLLSVALG